MRRFGRRIINRMRLPFLHFITITGTSLICFGEGAPVKTPERMSTTTRQSKVNVEDRTHLEESLRSFESQYAESEEIARKAAREYRDEAERESPDLMYGEDLGWLIAKKTTDAGTSPETGDIQSVRIEDREAAARNPLPNFATPRELLDYLEKAKSSDDATVKLRTLIELMDQDEQSRFAGVCLQTASLVRSASKLAEGFSALAPDGQNAELIRVGRELETLVKEARLSKPPRKA